MLAEVLATDVPVLVDADALTLLAREPDLVRRRSAPTVLTPHDREFARFGRDVGPDRIGAARRLAADLGAVVLLKGDATVVADPDGTTFVNGTGTAAWPPRAPATCSAGSPARARHPAVTGCRAVEAARRRRAPARPHRPAGRASAGRCSPATSCGGCPRPSAGCAGSGRPAWETRSA